MRRDLNLDYGQIGLLLALPVVVSGVVGPLFGLLADSGHRRKTMLWGGVVYSLSLAGNALAGNFTVLLVTFVLGAPAYGAFVSLAQIELMDLATDRHEQNMARWVLVGSFGVTAGPLLMGLLTTLGIGWRPVFLALALAGLVLTLAISGTGAAPQAQVTPTKETARGRVQGDPRPRGAEMDRRPRGGRSAGRRAVRFPRAVLRRCRRHNPRASKSGRCRILGGAIAGSALILPLVTQ